MDGLLSAIGIKNGTAVAAFIGALVSLKFIEDIAHWSLWKRATTVLAGAAVAAYATPLTVEILELSTKTEGAIAFLGGLFGMSLAGAVIKNLPELVKSLKTRIGG